MQNKCDKLKYNIQENNILRGKMVQENIGMDERHRKGIVEMNYILFDMADEIKEKNKETRKSDNNGNKSDMIAANRLESLNDIKAKLCTVQKQLADESHIRE